MSASDKIARLRELRAKATGGTWHSEAGYVMHANNPIARCNWLLGDERSKPVANAAAIVAAMNSLDALLECAEALEAHLVWHEERDKALSKQPPNTDVNWRRMEHREQIDKARLALQALAEGGA